MKVDHQAVLRFEDAPAGLAAALAAREARVVDFRQEHTRAYILAVSPQGRLFARYSTDPADVHALAHEAAVRAIVGADGVLRAPPVLERGPSWLLEVAIAGEPCVDASCAETVAAAAARIAELELPHAPRRTGARRRIDMLERGLKLARSQLPLADALRARRVLSRLELPPVTSHGDFHPGNVLLERGAAWVVDWEQSGRQVLGYDLMHFWATVPRPEVRAALLEAALDLAGTARRRQLLLLRYALVVRTIIGKLTAPMAFDRDPEGARALLALLPEIRAEAG